MRPSRARQRIALEPPKPGIRPRPGSWRRVFQERFTADVMARNYLRLYWPAKTNRDGEPPRGFSTAVAEAAAQTQRLHKGSCSTQRRRPRQLFSLRGVVAGAAGQVAHPREVILTVDLLGATGFWKIISREPELIFPRINQDVRPELFSGFIT